MRHLFAALVAVAAAVAGAPFAACAVEEGAKAPGFALADGKGASVSLDALRGRVVYVDFWASWCGPCRRSFPWMAELQQRYGERGLTVVAINVDRERAAAERFLAAVPSPFTVAFDPRGATPESWGVKGMPTSYLVDAQGNVALVEAGFRDERKPALEARIRALLDAR